MTGAKRSRAIVGSLLLLALLLVPVAGSGLRHAPAPAPLPIDGQTMELRGSARVSVKGFRKLKDPAVSLRAEFARRVVEALDQNGRRYLASYSGAKKVRVEFSQEAREELADAIAHWLRQAYQQSTGGSIDVSVSLLDLSVLMKANKGKAQAKLRASFNVQSATLGIATRGKYQAKLRGRYFPTPRPPVPFPFFTAAPPSESQLVVGLAGHGAGQVTGPAIDCPADCTERYAQGRSVILEATPRPGSLFRHWLGCDANPARDLCEVRLSGDAVVTAFFDPEPASQARLEVQATGSGGGRVSGVGIECGSDCSHTYTPGTPVLLTATEEAGSLFTGWTGCDVPSGDTCAVTPVGDRHVTARFEPRGVPRVVSTPSGRTLDAR